jgi:hypothetical protein
MVNGAADPIMETIVEVFCGVDRPESILTWKRSPQVQGLLTGLASGEIPLSHEGLNAVGRGRHITHLRSLLEHNDLLPYRDEHLARFEAWLAAKLEAITESAVRAPVEQFATWHHLRRLRRISAPGQTSDGPKRAAKQEITETIKFLTWLHETHHRTAATCTQQDVANMQHNRIDVDGCAPVTRAELLRRLAPIRFKRLTSAFPCRAVLPCR